MSMHLPSAACALVGLLGWPATAPLPAAELPGYVTQTTVSAAGRLDWTFALGPRSLVELPPEWNGEYSATSQHYECYVPSGDPPARGRALVFCISASPKPAGWAEWKAVCERQGMVFASPFGAGNDCPPHRRARIVLDVLDDLRRKTPIDTDRTYLAGISGGARMACLIGFALPEYFGGIVPMCAGGELRKERWLWHRVMARLSVAYVTGETDFNRAEVERLRMPVLEAMQVRARLWVVSKHGHAIAPSATLAEVATWLEEGLPARQALTRRWPAARIDSRQPWDRAAWSEALLAEAKERIQTPAEQFGGLMQLNGVMNRWPDLPAAKTAKELLADYAKRSERPWSKIDVEEKSRWRIAEARAASAFALGELLPPYDDMRDGLIDAALARWKEVLERRPEGKLLEEARRQMAELRNARSGKAAN